MLNSVDILLKIQDQATATLHNVSGELTGMSIRVATVANAFRVWEGAVGTLAGTFGEMYHLFIGQNETMRQQILATQSALIAVNDVYQNGVKIVDPSAAIKSYEQPIRSSLNQIAKDSLELVGVTSSQLTEVMQIALQSANNIANQSIRFPSAVQAAERLTTSFAAAFGSLQIPLFQANQEIRSILTATIDQNSRLAISLGINNEQVRLWQSQGKLVDMLVQKLQPFVAANKLAAFSISGIMSNIKEIQEITTRMAGQLFTERVVAGLDVIYQYLLKNQKSIVDFFTSILSWVIRMIDEILAAVSPHIGWISEVIASIRTIVFSLFQIVGDSLEMYVKTLGALGQTLVKLMPFFADILEKVAKLMSNEYFQTLLETWILWSLFAPVIGKVIDKVRELGVVLWTLFQMTKGQLTHIQGLLGILNALSFLGVGGGWMSNLTFLVGILTTIPGVTKYMEGILKPLVVDAKAWLGLLVQGITGWAQQLYIMFAQTAIGQAIIAKMTAVLTTQAELLNASAMRLNVTTKLLGGATVGLVAAIALLVAAAAWWIRKEQQEKESLSVYTDMFAREKEITTQAKADMAKIRADAASKLPLTAFEMEEKKKLERKERLTPEEETKRKNLLTQKNAGTLQPSMEKDLQILEDKRNREGLTPEEAARLEALRKKETGLTSEQRAKQKSLSNVLKESSLRLEGMLRDGADLKFSGAEQTQWNALQKEMQTWKDEMDRLSPIETKPKSLVDYGGVSKQIDTRLDAAYRRYNEERDDTSFSSGVKEIMSLTKEERELGKITDTEAVARLENIIRNTKVTLDQKRDAQKEIDTILQQSADREIQLVKTATYERKQL